MEGSEEPQGEPRVVRSGSRTLRDFIPIYIPGIERGIIDHGPRKGRFLDFLKAQPNREWLLKTGIRGRISSFAYALRNSVRRQGGSSHGGAPSSRTRRFRVPFVRKVKWQFVVDYGKNWIRNPMNMALLVWLIFVGAGLLVLGLLMTGILDQAIPNSSQRTRWTEIVNQILNALFTIMCLYQHPKIFHHMIILCRWNPKDAVELRAAYCKSSAARPWERVHMAIIIALLHLTCATQYMLCALYWGWTSKDRPDWAENLCIGLGIAAPIGAALYTVYSPLGKKGADTEADLGELMTGPRPSSVSTSDDESRKQPNGLPASASIRVVVTEPEWLGGTFDCRDDVTVAYLSLFCTFCVFGWNMERLGFGNMYVHIVTFVLLCIAPLLVFNVSALNINDGTLKYTVGISGCVLCFCGLLYGGFWRIQMRKKFKLPGNPFCCGYPAVTDCFQWLFCWACTLAQEVRTGNYYEVEDDSFYRKSLEEEAKAALRPLQRESQAGPRPSTDQSNPKIVKKDNPADDPMTELPSVTVDHTMSAPAPEVIDIEESQHGKELKQ